MLCFIMSYLSFYIYEPNLFAPMGDQVAPLGKAVRLQGINWPGLHITHVPSGLDRTPVMSLALRIKAMGFNVVRLTWDTNTVLSNPVVPWRRSNLVAVESLVESLVESVESRLLSWH